METALPALGLPTAAFDPRALMPDATEIWLEIGFGGGEHMAAQATRRPDVLILGVEPFLNGVASAVRHIDAANLTNVRLHVGDARDLIAWLPDTCLDRLFILFPDPWPKTRHAKRRLVNREFLLEAARVMKPGARLRFATDWADYASQVLRITADDRPFRWLAEAADDWRIPPAEGVSAVRVSPRGLRIDLSGKQPEQCELLVQFVALSPGKTCHLRFKYETGISGLTWRVYDLANLLASILPLYSADIEFTSTSRIARLALGYSRAAGTPRQEGSITLRDMELGCAN